MNAYELAKAQQAYSAPTFEEIIKQQADRIKDLEKLLEHSVGADCREMRYIQEIENRDARIAELEKEADRLSNHADELRKVHADRIKDLTMKLNVKAIQVSELERKQQSAEPVAWTNQKWLDGIAKEPQLFQPLFVHGKQTEHNTISLYTTPQIKELSDEEIIILRQDTNPKTTDNWADTLSFARALLKKASEK